MKKKVNNDNIEKPQENIETQNNDELFSGEKVEDIKDYVRNKSVSRQKIKKVERDKKKKKTIKVKSIVRADDIDKVYYNRFDIFFIKIWASVCAFISGTAKLAYKGSKYLFRISLPMKYLKALTTIILIALLYFICILPFMIPMLKSQKEVELKNKTINQYEQTNKDYIDLFKKYGINNPDAEVEKMKQDKIKKDNNKKQASVEIANKIFNQYY